MSYCKKCGKIADIRDSFCSKCGYSLPPDSTKWFDSDNKSEYTRANTRGRQPKFSEKSGLIALLLAMFFGTLGFQSFYTGKIGTGILQLITCGGFGIWTLIDVIRLITGSFRDKNGRIVQL